jgi:hypothetical protein
MKTSIVGILAAAILMLLAGAAFGIAQAGGNQPYDPMLSFGDQDVYPSSDVWQAREAVETGSLPAGSNAVGNQPYDPTLSFGDQDVPPSLDMGQAVEFCPEDCFAGTDWQTRGAVETGAIPAMVPEESWLKEYGND